MAVHVSTSAMWGDATPHRARSVGCGRWVVSYLHGRTLTGEQAVGALQLAEQIVPLTVMARGLGLTLGEVAHMAAWGDPSRLSRLPAE
ncbi:hypothetical protein [Nocardia farcinica]